MLQDKDLVAIQEARTKVEAAHAAWEKYRNYSQDQVNAIVEAMNAAAQANARSLAEMAVQETSYGNVEDKLAKNILCSQYLVSKIRDMKTVGVIREVPDQKVVEIAVPVGVVAAVVPTTNPTSTVMYKSIISLKSGNAVVLSPHPRAKACTCRTADILHRAALDAGAPEGIIQCLGDVTRQSTQELMRHPKTGVILATGGSGMVRAAYSSGKPAYGVGPGNVPVLLDSSYDVADAVKRVVSGKAFDYGTVCSSEQSLVAPQQLRNAVLEELRKQKAYICTAEQSAALAKMLVSPSGAINADCVGQAPAKIASMAGFEVPADTSIIAAEIFGVGKEHPLSCEKLSPVLALLFVPDFNAGMDTCEAILKFGGLGHTCVIYSNDENRTREFGLRMPANRVLVNTSAPQGSVGITTNVLPSMTLGCGAEAGNSTADNVGPLHLINTKRIAYKVREAEEALQIPSSMTVPAPAPAIAAPVAAAPQPVNGGVPGLAKELVESMVERYLRDRGLVGDTTAQPAVPATVASRPGVTAQIVDRFLAGRAATASATPVSCSCPTIPAAPVGASREPESQSDSEADSGPEIEIVDFVCEEDVRQAMADSRKIYIGPKTIVTPSARELANRDDILVRAERS